MSSRKRGIYPQSIFKLITMKADARVFNASKARVLNMDWTWGYSLGGFPPLADLATDRHSLGA